MTEPERPTEMTYPDYLGSVQLAADTAWDAKRDDPEEYPVWASAVRYAIRGDRLYTGYGWSLMTVLLSDTDPDRPDYCQNWRNNVDLRDDPSWSDCVSQMAYVCYFSDVMGEIKDREEDTEAEEEPHEQG